MGTSQEVLRGPTSSSRELTASETPTIVRFLPREATQATALTQRVGALREQVGTLQSNVGRSHVSAFYTELRVRTEAKARIDPRQLLNALARNQGMSWTAIAKVMKVSIPAVRKWRNGEPPAPENRRRLAVLVSFIEMLEDHFSIADVSTWMEMRLWEGVPVTPTDIYSSGALDLLLDLAAGHLDAQAVLDAHLPGWRDTYLPSEFEVFTAPDGDLAIKKKT